MYIPFVLPTGNGNRLSGNRRRSRDYLRPKLIYKRLPCLSRLRLNTAYCAVDSIHCIALYSRFASILEKVEFFAPFPSIRRNGPGNEPSGSRCLPNSLVSGLKGGFRLHREGGVSLFQFLEDMLIYVGGKLFGNQQNHCGESRQRQD